ncbi:MAG TPA: hypothetical protein VK978_02860 [Candidatus Saccharimonadales bacterium]|nr:hypothetical protein [Candidatus Saccharimonadales bacterium]
MNTQRFMRPVAALTVVGGIVAASSLAAYAATLTSASLRLQDPRVGRTSQYTLSANGFSTGTAIGCIEVDLGTAVDGTGAVTGLNTGNSTFVSQTITGTGTWTVSNAASADHKLRLINTTPVAPQSGAQTAVFGAVVNGSTANTGYYAVFKTYTTDACTTAVDTTTVQFVYTDGQAASVSVDGTLTFSVAGITGNGTTTVSGSTITNGLATTSSTIPFGTATAAANRVAAQNLTIATNADSGYTVYARYTGQPTSSGGKTISDLATHTNATPGAFSAAGTEAFGYTTEDGSLGTGTLNRFSTTNKWAAMTTTNEEIIYNGTAASSETVKIGYQVGVSSTTEPGTYNNTVIYTATPVY